VRYHKLQVINILQLHPSSFSSYVLRVVRMQVGLPCFNVDSLFCMFCHLRHWRKNSNTLYFAARSRRR
jgi:hypothetical protein